MNQLPVSLEAWKSWNQFIVCDGKIPVDPYKQPGDPGRKINPHDPNNWLPYDQAITLASMLGLGVGFVFTVNDPFWFLDVDHCRDPATGEYNPIAQQMLEVFKGAAVEISSSGDGLHFFGCGEVPEHAKKNKQYGIEFYNEGRFVLLTGNGAEGDVWLDWSAQVEWLVQSYFQPKGDSNGDDWTDRPVPEWHGPEDDDVLIGKMLNQKGSAATIFGSKATLQQLFNNDVEALARAFPSLNETDPYDRSSADAALANHLAFWTGKNHERIKRIMWRSGLVREKWTKHKSYLTTTISNAVAGCNNVYSSIPRSMDSATNSNVVQETNVEGNSGTNSGGLEKTTPSNVGVAEPVMRVGTQFMSPHQQVEYFKNCVYIRRAHGVLTAGGLIMKPEVFKASYAGYTFSLDSDNDKTTKNAWEAFIDNQAISFPKVDGTCFRPHLPYQEVVHEYGDTLVNLYKPINVPRKKGDVSLFLDHMRKLFPVQSDRDIVMAYMAAMVQHIGVKFQWCPIIQGGEGNGKSLLGRVIEHSLGSRYVHYPNASDLAKNGLKFNGWIEGKLAVIIEEIFVSDRRELTEPLKVLITNDRLEIQYKGQNQFTGDNLANIIMYTNHKDAMKVNIDQRRYFIVYTAQQTYQDMMRDSMDGDYFNRIYNWLKFEGGYEMVAEYLHTYQIPDELNPATNLQRAPKSSSSDEAIQISLGPIEQNILEAIEEERQGFRGGYVSSKCLIDLLKEMKLDNKITPRRRHDIMEGLGYIRHPWLNGGRVDNVIAAEGTKSTIYVKGHPTGVRPGHSWVKTDYERAQGYIQVTGDQSA